MRDTEVQALGQEDLLEQETATHSSTLAWKIPWTEEPGGLQSMRSQQVRHWACPELSISLENTQSKSALCHPPTHTHTQTARYMIQGWKPNFSLTIPLMISPREPRDACENEIWCSLLDTVHRVIQSQTWLKWLSTHAFLIQEFLR